MAQKEKEQRIRYKLEDTVVLDQNEMNIYNVPFAGNRNTCRETFARGERMLEYKVHGDITMDLFVKKPVFRDELVECLYSVSKQFVSMVQNGLRLERVVLDPRFMYINLNDFSVPLVYLPFDSEEWSSNVFAFFQDMFEKLTFAHTPALECANQLMEYLNNAKSFNAIQFSLFVKDLRLKSQLLMIANHPSAQKVKKSAKAAKMESEILRAEDAARKAEIAKMQAENEAKKLTEYAKRQAEAARSASEMCMRAEAARIQARIDKRTEEEARLADEVRTAREEEMRAEEARMRAEQEARKNLKEAERYASEARKQNEEVGRLSERRHPVDEEETVVLRDASKAVRMPVLIREKTGERIYINKRAFCIGKADQGVDFKITDNKSISRRHAYITNINGVYYVRDNNSTNHTYLNGEMIHTNTEVVLPDNSMIRLSNEEFLFKYK